MFSWLKKVLPVSEKAERTIAATAPVERGAAQADKGTGSAALKKQGNEYLSQGELDHAAECYRQAIAINPDYAEAYINLGFVLKEQRLYEEAERTLKQAVLLNPEMEDAYYLLASVLQGMGKLDEAIDNYNKAIELKPDFEVIYRDLSLALFQNGQPANARSVLQKAITLYPTNADFHYYLGKLYSHEGASDTAIDCFLQALSIQPDFTEAHNDMGLMLQAQGKLDAAIASHRRALAIDPDFAVAHNNLASALQAQHKLEEAAEHLQTAIAINPDYAEAHSNLGVVLNILGKPEAAVECCQRALSIKPDYAEAHSHLADALQALGKLDAAVESYHRALALKPGLEETHNNLGHTLEGQGKLDEAIQNYRRAISLRPDYAEAHHNLGHAHQAQGKLDEAIACFRHALSLKPDYVQVHSNLLFMLSYHSKCSPVQYLTEAKCYGSTVLAQSQPYTHWPSPPFSDRKRLRVGLVSGDFVGHPVGFFLENILAYLNPARVELVAYPTRLLEDDLTERIKPRFASWNPIAGMVDEAAARKIYEDGVHVLIDLAGHTAHNRLPVFAWRPAPVQVSWLGYWAGTGIPNMDYLLADQVSVPELHRTHFTETVWYLPDTRFCFTPPKTKGGLAVTPPPVLSEGYITFGCFQNLAKVNDGVLALWTQILHAMPRARLRLQIEQLFDPGARAHLLQRLGGIGIAPERVTLLGSVPREDYLAAHAEVDIILDTFPYPGGTTTCEALWMGVPTVTLAGDTLLARQGASLLTCAGLEDWVAHNEEEYVAIAHASDVERLAKLRAGLRQQVLASPLYDAPRFARHLEDALQGMWQHKMSRIAEHV